MPFMIPVVVLLGIFSIPIVAILVAHQHRMAETMHRNYAQAMQPTGEMEALRREVLELRHLVHQQTIAMDDLKSKLAGQSGPREVASRFSY